MAFRRRKQQSSRNLPLALCVAEARWKAVPTKTFKFTVDCQQPAEDTIIEPKDAPGAGFVSLRGLIGCFSFVS